MAVNDGGPAFPIISKVKITGEHDDERICSGTPGISVRDYFAAQVMSKAAETITNPSEAAKVAYKLADAMIAERARTVRS